MNKLYFRAWLKDEEKMCEVINIYSLDNCTEVTCQSIGGEENDYADYRLDEVILMQGIEVDDQVVYEGDLVKYSTPWYEDYPTYRVEFHEGSFYFDTDGYTCIPINSMSDLNELEVIGNIYEKEMGK